MARSGYLALLMAVLQFGPLQVVNAAAISSPSALEAPAWGQCGGSGYSGAGQCPAEYECDDVNGGKHTNSLLTPHVMIKPCKQILICN